MHDAKTVIMSLGGSIIVPDGVNTSFLKEFRKLILSLADGSLVEGKKHRVVIVTGGGKISRKYQDAAEEITAVTQHDLDMIGIQCTKLNAELLRSIFAEHAHEKIVDNPEEKIQTDKNIIIGSGWKPGCSSDKDAVLLAKNLGATTVINLSNIDYVYDKDPAKFKDAEPIENITWDAFLSITGEEWKPGLNAPFDPVASKLAKELGLTVAIMNGTDLENLKLFLMGKQSKGTIIEG